MIACLTADRLSGAPEPRVWLQSVESERVFAIRRVVLCGFWALIPA